VAGMGPHYASTSCLSKQFKVHKALAGGSVARLIPCCRIL
jgi:hypothetical protein